MKKIFLIVGAVFYTALISLGSVYIYKKQFVIEDMIFDDEESVTECELAFKSDEIDPNFKFEIVKEGDDYFCYMTDDDSNDDFKLKEDESCYIYKYPKKRLHIV